MPVFVVCTILLLHGAVFAKPWSKINSIDGRALQKDDSYVQEKSGTGFVENNHLVTNDTASHVPHFQRRDLLSKHRRKCDTKYQLKRKLEARKFRDEILEKLLLDRALETIEYPEFNSTRSLNESHVGPKNRTKRWADYDANYDWENGGKDYTITGENKQKESKFERFAKSWQKNALKAVFAFSFCCMILCCCLACCKKICGRLCGICCWQCKEWRDICLNRDPTYRRIRQFADDYGLKIDYDQYKKLKGNYEEALKKQGHTAVDFSGRN